MGCGYNLIVEHLSSMLEALGSIQTQQKQTNNNKQYGKYGLDKSQTLLQVSDRSQRCSILWHSRVAMGSGGDTCHLIGHEVHSLRSIRCKEASHSHPRSNINGDKNKLGNKTNRGLNFA